MQVYDADGNLLSEYDLELGRLESTSEQVAHVWIVDTPEESHEEIVAEYPETGGKDIKVVIDVAEVGHWETQREDGTAVDWEKGYSDDWPCELPIPDTWEYQTYILYTDAELEEMAENKRLAEEEQAKYEAREAMLDSLPEDLADADEALCDLYEELMVQVETNNDQDVAITDLYELLIGE